ncbi:MAG: sulfatase [Saprospiraceae bacterium]|nr:sulfatase [Saprospiraceae bacterium]
MQHILIFVYALLTLSLVSAQDRPHIIYIIADDVSWNDFGCYGNEVVRTPHIDALAQKGIVFRNAFLTASSCSPSRCSIITGRYPHNTGAAELHSPLPESQIPFPLLLQEAGYYTVQSGKSHFGKPALRAFDHGYEMEDAGNGGEERWVQCLQERPRDQPIFAWFAATDAHRAWGADDFATPHNPDDLNVPPYLVDNVATRQDLASYYNEIQRFDHYIGEVVAELKAQEIFDHTLIVVMADNGMPFPRAKTRVYDSGMQTPLVLHWPNGIDAQGTVCQSLVSVVDLAPTFLELADVAIPDHLQGKSFVDLFHDPSQDFRQYVYAEHNWHDFEAHERMVRSKDFLYVRNARTQFPNGGPADSKRSASQYALNAARDAGRLTPAQVDNFIAPRPHEELFNVAVDSLQLLNLASVPLFQSTLPIYRQALDDWIAITKDNVPDKITADGFDRQTGELRPSVPAFNKVPRGEMPGIKRGALTAIGTPGF